MVFLLLFLACTRIASSTNYSASKLVVNIVVRHKISMSGNNPGLFTWLWSDWINYVVIQHFSRSVTMSFLCFTTNGVLVLAFLFLILCEHFQFLIFVWLLHAPSHSYHSYIIMHSGGNTSINIQAYWLPNQYLVGLRLRSKPGSCLLLRQQRNRSMKYREFVN